MNRTKTEFLVISSRQMASKITAVPLNVGDSSIAPSLTVCNLGVKLDRFATMEEHSSSICRGAYLQLRNIGKLRSYFDQASLECVVHAFISSKLDYCNSLLVGLPLSLLHRLQSIQNTAARILTGTPKHAHITPVLRDLHWLPVGKRILYKTLLLVFKALHHLAPVYIQELIVEHRPSRNLRSSNQRLLVVPYTSSSLVQSRAFSVVGPRLWNDLPYDIRIEQSIELFKTKLKTFLFRDFYG